MFALRKVSKHGKPEFNLCLGESYTVIREETDKEEFDKLLSTIDDKAAIYGAIIYNNGAGVNFLSRGEWNYIVSENGKTYSNVSHQ